MPTVFKLKSKVGFRELTVSGPDKDGDLEFEMDTDDGTHSCWFDREQSKQLWAELDAIHGFSSDA